MSADSRGPRGPYYSFHGNDLAKLRIRLGLTQGDVAIAAGVSVRTIRAHEGTPWPNARQSGREVHAAIAAVLSGLARSRETGRLAKSETGSIGQP